MLDAIARFDFIIAALTCLEGFVISWVLPHGVWPTLEKRRRVMRYLTPVFGVACLVVAIMPWNHGDSLTDGRELIVVLLTPLFLVGGYVGAIMVEEAVRQRMRRSTRRRNRQ